MLKRHKDLLRPLVAALRSTLAGAAASDGGWQRGDLDRELERLGIAEDGSALPHDVVRDPAELPARAAALAAIEAAVNGAKGAEAAQKRQAARAEFVERAAYTWINRLLALRTMEARGLIDETLRANPDYDGLSEALYVLRQEQPQRAGAADGGWWAVIGDACAAQAAALPGLFDPADPSAALRPSTPALLRCVALVGNAPNGFSLAEADDAFADPDAIGWAYQFYQEAAKARVYAKLATGGKAASRAEIAAATQLFTEPYMVQWLLQNSLGRSYHEAYPDSKIPEGWAYYIRNRPEGQSAPEQPRPLEALDLIDPCCGSGHFLREAFDMFAAMYRERHPEWSAAQIADRIFERHLHGIDLDPRAAQLAALTLYLRALDLIREEARRQRRPLSAIGYRPSAINIATTPSGLSVGALQRHLRRHPEDRVMRPLLEGVFAALEQADILGSLLRPAEHIDAAIATLQGTHQMAMDFDADDATLRRTITALARSDPAELKRLLLDRVAQSFAAEAGDSDVAARLFGREAAGGVRLLQLLDRKYAVVVTNPPYMGSGNMDKSVSKYVSYNYTAAKGDLSATFLLKCFQLCKKNGRFSLVTKQDWMYLPSYASLRAVLAEQRPAGHSFQGLLYETTIETLLHLGSGAFEEISGEVVNVVLTAFACRIPLQEHSIVAVDARGKFQVEKSAQQIPRLMALSPILSKQRVLLELPGSPLSYDLTRQWQQLFEERNSVSIRFATKDGLGTRDNARFIRFFWELPDKTRWAWHHKGGGYLKWRGLEFYKTDWREEGARIRWSRNPRFQNTQYYFIRGVVWTKVAQPSLSARILIGDTIFDDATPGAFPYTRTDDSFYAIAEFLNSRVATFLARSLSPTLNYSNGLIGRLPLILTTHPGQIARVAHQYKGQLLTNRPLEREFLVSSFATISVVYSVQERVGALLHTVEGYNEYSIISAADLQKGTIDELMAKTAAPAGFHPLIAGYDALPVLPAELDLPSLPQEVLDYLAAHERTAPSAAELGRIKERLRRLYEAGPGVKEAEEPAEVEGGDEEEGAVSGAHIPIPTETFLEELSVTMQLHPISVYWLLEELRREGARCKPEEQRLLEDRLSVLVLRLLGHRWPKQIEAGEAVPPWADKDGIIPLGPGTGQPTLAERLRERLRTEDGATGAQRAEALLVELTGLGLEEWLRREFFKRHTRQFKYRPIAWHLASDPAAAGGEGKGRGRRGGSRNVPAFECLLYYHACAGDAIARIRTQYVEPLLRSERQRLEAARRANQETESAQAQARIQELEEFNRRLAAVAEEGFASPELARLIADDPLDRWAGDGYLAPIHVEALLRQEQAWRVDLNDGVRVNIAPLQLAGLLAGDVLKAADARKAIADRARWRSDERRWVRAGKLPRCGWMDEAVPESPAWTALAPQREAERAKLEEKRRAVAAHSGEE